MSIALPYTRHTRPAMVGKMKAPVCLCTGHLSASDISASSSTSDTGVWICRHPAKTVTAQFRETQHNSNGTYMLCHSKPLIRTWQQVMFREHRVVLPALTSQVGTEARHRTTKLRRHSTHQHVTELKVASVVQNRSPSPACTPLLPPPPVDATVSLNTTPVTQPHRNRSAQTW